MCEEIGEPHGLRPMRSSPNPWEHLDRTSYPADFSWPCLAVFVLQQKHVALFATAYVNKALVRDSDDMAVTKSLRKWLNFETVRELDLPDPATRGRHLVGLKDVVVIWTSVPSPC